jgi:hypothetical protein
MELESQNVANSHQMQLAAEVADAVKPTDMTATRQVLG